MSVLSRLSMSPALNTLAVERVEIADVWHDALLFVVQVEGKAERTGILGRKRKFGRFRFESKIGLNLDRTGLAER